MATSSRTEKPPSANGTSGTCLSSIVVAGWRRQTSPIAELLFPTMLMALMLLISPAGHLHYFCLRSLVRLLNDHGLRIVDSRLSRRYVGCIEVTIERSVPGA